MDQRLYPVSPSKIERWLGCPRHFLLQDLQRRRGGGVWAHFTFANAIHSALRMWWEEPFERRTPERGAELLARAWSDDGFQDREHSERWRSIAAGMVSSYCEQLDPSQEPHSTERSLAARTEHTTIRGRIDCLAPSGDGVMVIDYKTGRQVPTEDTVRSSQQLAIYALCVQQSLKLPCTTVAIHHIPSGVSVAWEHSPETLQRHIDRIDRIGREMADAEALFKSDPVSPELAEAFPARPGGLCGYCDVRDFCSEAAGEAKPPWAGLPEGGYEGSASSAQNEVWPPD